ncbi:MAG TPA: transporter [Casimicrobiaceae bacterium]|nr:transporter [Casimicrobiaceae bacterium]
MNFLIASYAYTQGGLSFDPALPVTNEQLTTSSIVLAYARSLDLWGRSAKVDMIVPYTWLSGSADYAGQPLARDISGFTDSRIRVSVNFYGAPALNASEFRDYAQDVIVGASLQVSVPWGQYAPDRLVNLSNHRWSFKPELGVSKAMGPWTFELAAAGTFFTDNDDFYGGKTRAQQPVYSAQLHAIYSFRSGVWASLDATYFTGGRTTVDGVRDANLQQNWRTGLTLAIPIDRRDSLKIYASSGVAARTGNSFDLAGIAWQYRWGGGL